MYRGGVRRFNTRSTKFTARHHCRQVLSWRRWVSETTSAGLWNALLLNAFSCTLHREHVFVRTRVHCFGGRGCPAPELSTTLLTPPKRKAKTQSQRKGRPPPKPAKPSALQRSLDTFLQPLAPSAPPLHHPCVTFRLVIAPLRGPGRSHILPFACCVGSLLSVDRCGRCSCWYRCYVRGAHWLVCWGCAECGTVCRLPVSGAQ